MKKRFGLGLGIQSDPLESGDEGIFKHLLHGLDILRMKVGTGLDVAKERPGLPMGSFPVSIIAWIHMGK